MTKSLRCLWLLFIAVVFTMGHAFAQSSNPSSGGSYKSEADLRRQAEKYFKHEDYTAALPLYSQLLSLNQKDALLNYRYGICLLIADKDKTSAYNYLEFASRDEKTNEDVLFYIARTLQLKYRFDDAISTYKDFIKWVGKTAAEKFDVEHQIELCKNAKELMKSRVNVTVIQSKEVSMNAIYGAYNVSNAAGKFLATPDKFMTSLDKRKIAVPIMFLTADGQTIYYTSYGKKADNGKDIYVIRKLASGEWGIPENLGNVVNTKYDEDYPYLNADGKTLYFSSKGHNSMGGYDIFKTTFDGSAGEWSEPVNLGAGINSPDDDFFYMPVSDGVAQFASTKETAKGTVTIYTIETAASKRMLATVHGRYKSIDQARADGKISVLRKSDNGLVATSRTDARTGEYELSIPAGDEYEIVVEGGGYMPHVEDFSVPAMDRAVTIAQQINMDRRKDVEELEIRNQFIDMQVVDATPAAKNVELLNGQIVKSDSQQSNNLTMQQLNKENKIQVIKEEYKVDELNKQNLQPFNVGGQVVYATPPESKSLGSESKVPDSELSQSNEISGATQNTELETQNSADSSSQSGVRSSVLSPSNNVSDKTQNPIPTDKDVVKTAFSDAQELDEEAKQMTADAADANATAIQKDSVSKAQLAQVNNALKAGDEETAREMERQSQLNADSAQQERALANQLEDNARAKLDEAIKAYADAKQLMKNSRVDTSAQVAMNKSKHDKKKEVSGAESGVQTSQLSQSNEVPSKTQNSQDSISEFRVQSSESRKLAGSNNLSDTTQNTQLKTENSTDSTSQLRVQSSPQVRRTPDSFGDSVSSGAKSQQAELSQSNNSSSMQVQSNERTNVIDVTKATKVNEDSLNSPITSNTSIPREPPSPSTPSTTSTAPSTGSVSIAENKSVTSTNTPLTSEEATEQVKELQQESKDFKAQSDTLKEQAKKSDDKDEKMALMQASKDLAAKSKEKDKEAKKELAVANQLKKQEEKNPAQANANVPAEQKQVVEQPIADSIYTKGNETANQNSSAENNNVAKTTTQTSKETNAVEGQNSNATSVGTNTINPNEQVSGQNNSAVVVKGTDIKLAVQKTDQAKTTDGNTSIVSSSQSNGKDLTSTFSPTKSRTGEGEGDSLPLEGQGRAADIIKTVSPEAVKSYKEYIATKNESDAQAKQAEDMQTKIATMPPSAQRDQLIQQANDLSMASIKSWQAAQVKLNEVKEIDLSAEAKLKQAFPQPVAKTNETASATQGNSAPQPKDSLMTQAVTHREMAENAADTSTEKSELQKTKQLIVESANAKKNEPTKAIAVNNQANNQTGNSTSGIYTDQNSNNTSSKSATPIAENKSVATTSNESSVISNNTSENTPADKSSQKDVENKSKVREIISEENAPENNSTVTTSMAVLDAKTLHVDEAAVFSYSPQPVYNAANPVPMNPQLPEGLVFKVQIGAFHNPLSPDAFKNVQPLSGETTRPGWIRYCVGLFRTFEPANLVKTEMRSSGYKDAFVVAYYNGKRISLFDAYSIINRSGSNEKELYAVATEQETHHLSSMNIRAASNLVSNDEDAASFYGTSSAKTSTDESSVEYAVQVGVYKTNVVPKKLQSLIPLNAEPYKNSLYRFTTGHFSTHDLADSARKIAVNTGVKDAFIIIYKGGKRAGENYSSVISSKTNNATASSLNAPASTSTNEIIFKVQIGAYRNDLSEAKLTELKNQTNAEISQSLSASGLHLIYAGSFADYNAALLLKNELMVRGIKDAFVAAFSGDTKIPVNKARK